jgi:hypothetical protein
MIEWYMSYNKSLSCGLLLGIFSYSFFFPLLSLFYCFFFFFFFFFFFSQVSAVTDQTGMLEIGGNPGDFDDDEGGGLVS